MPKRDDIPTVNVIIEEQAWYSLAEICRHCGLTNDELVAMVDEGLVQPEGQSMAQWRFSVIAVQRVHTAVRLQQDLRLNLAGAALALDLLDELERLRRRVRTLENLLE